MKRRFPLLAAGAAVMLVPVGGVAWSVADGGSGDGSLSFDIRGSDAWLVREVAGNATDAVQGVPARPVHSFDWDGDSITPVDGSLRAEVDPMSNTGEITAQWSDANGDWTYTQTVFAPPHHPTGVRMGPSAGEVSVVEGDPVTTDVFLHGDTGAGGPVLPTIFNSLATWGPARVTLNGEPFENPYDGPAPDWAGHLMTTVGVRHDDGTVTANDGEDIYHPQLADVGDTQPHDREVHLVFHDGHGPEVEGNFPSPFSFFHHLVFEDVKVEVTHSD